jgi:penicillin amidase
MLKKILLSTLIILFLVSLLAYYYLKSKSPMRSGELKLDGLTETVIVSYDHYGVPHISAKNDRDLYRAFGYVHAQDRLFQMEMIRRLSQGKLAEVFGEKLIKIDKLFRTMGLKDYSKEWINAMEKRGSKALFNTVNDYLAGVNAFVKNGAKPVEFELVNFPEHIYTQEDVVSIAGYMAFSFAFAIKDDPLVTHLSQTLGESYLKDLGINYTKGFEKIPVDALSQKSLLAKNISKTVMDILDEQISVPLFHGSNSWLVSPKRSASGKAMLVNDPHIGYSQPSVWYEAQLKSDNTNIYGHFLALTPFPQLGFNEDIAWGLTMFENDDMDLYAEKLNPENDSQYWAIDHWKSFKTRIETIRVKDNADIAFEVKESRHGPIINPIYEDDNSLISATSEVDQPIALWWAFKNTDNKIMEAFYQLPHIKTIHEASDIASKIHAPGLNLMFANAKGDIGWWASAKLPIRPEHVNSKVILDGASGKDDLLGFHDFSYNPKQINPESGVLYSANNQTADMGNGLVPGYYAPTDRASRITELLSSKEKLSVDFMKKMLIDSQSKTGLLFQKITLPILNKSKPSLSKIELDALSIYSQWNGEHLPDQQGAAIHNRFRMSLLKLAMEDELGEKYYPNFQFSFLMARTIWRLLPNEKSPWWDNVNTSIIETREQLIKQAWKGSTQFLTEKYGDDLTQWTWENEASVVYEHPLGSQQPLNKLFNIGPLPTMQGIEVINNTRLKQDGKNLKITMGPSTRRIIDFADIENTWSILPTGQSGVVLDKHYDDQAVDYSLGNFRHQYITDKQVQDNLEGELILVP